MDSIKLSFNKIINTIDLLVKRIEERLPNSGLIIVGKNFSNIAKHSKQNIDLISKPNLILRLFLYLAVLIGGGLLLYSISYIDLEINDTKLSNIAAISESIFNNIVLLGAAIFFLVTSESRIKRKRIIKQLNQLRVMVHVIDMHQLTKSPALINISERNTESSPKRIFTKFELERYFDYCSEMTSLIAKVAALYAQGFPDEDVLQTVNDIEILCTGLSQKIWQKLIVLNSKGNSIA